MDPQVTYTFLGPATQLLILAILIWQIAPDRRRQLHLMQAFIIGAFVASLYTVRNYFLNLNTYYMDLYLRFQAFLFNPNHLALMLVIGIPIAWHLANQEDYIKVTWLNHFYVPIALLAVILTASRGAVLALIVALLIIPFTLPLSSNYRIITLAVTLVVSIYALTTIVPEYSWQRLASISTELQGGSFGYRLDIWEEGVKLYSQHPVLGVGAGTFSWWMEKMLGTSLTAHNTFLSILVERGLVGFGLLFALILVMTSKFHYMPTQTKIFWVILLLTWALGAFSLTWEHKKTCWLLLGLLASQTTFFEERDRTLQILS